MTTPHRVQVVRRQIGLMGAVILTLTALEALSYGLFFGVSLLGFLIVTELSSSQVVTVPWRSRLRRLGALGLFVYAVIATLRLSDLLSAVTLP
ncbi:hypothetical protein SAMN05421752_10835 [Natronorubrum thiooxidans]|uniref:Uncharacterized protein n=1 Tax=Natronorubrum thiooxidans TaxID=308853 RepID=A0A1N7FS77_9EURY|nr:hypothetical protein SAMN05421752_10835 [Natronorubrum thiooxidans]